MRASDAMHISAAREHTVASRRRTRAHVVITHDLNAKNHTLYELFALAAHSGERDQPYRLKVITGSGDRDHADHGPRGPA